MGADRGDEYEPMTGSGWDVYLHTLSQYFVHFAGWPAVYVEAEGPASSAGEEAWTRLVAAIAGHERVALGAAVRIDLGPHTIEGHLDYVTPTFVGLRTTDSLIRFHGRWALGMCIAVSQHVYVDALDADALDAEALGAAWGEWLRRTVG